MVRLIDHDDLEALLGIHVDLLRLRDLLEQILHDDTVIIPNIRGCDLKMVNGGNDVELEFAVGCGLEDARIDLDFLDTGAVELFEGCDDTCLLSGTRGTVDEKVREVTALRLREDLECCPSRSKRNKRLRVSQKSERTSDRKRSDKSA